MIGKIRLKISSNKGESFAEVLISIVVMSFALLTLATMITVSWRLVQRSMDDDAMRQLSVSEMDDYLAGISGPDDGSKGSVKFSTNAATTDAVRISGADDNYDDADILEIRYYSTSSGSEKLFSFWPVPD